MTEATQTTETADDCGCAAADAAAETPHHHGYMGDKVRYLARLRRIEGQVRGIHRMVDEEKYCIDILTQISALTSALENVALGLLDDHMRHCVADAARLGGAAAEEKFTEAAQAIARLVKS
ncbi:DNA-binding transcriptional regulator, FrmR family [Micrococcales bacterium KH10]|nr:DNA-binding transcriptional regulator, FrmR family [Micrococcales bacterium KH10]